MIKMRLTEVKQFAQGHKFSSMPESSFECTLMTSNPMFFPLNYNLPSKKKCLVKPSEKNMDFICNIEVV
jgi:hypothetical protein